MTLPLLMAVMQLLEYIESGRLTLEVGDTFRVFIENGKLMVDMAYYTFPKGFPMGLAPLTEENILYKEKFLQSTNKASELLTLLIRDEEGYYLQSYHAI